MRYSIGDVSRVLGMTTSALHFYEKEGIIETPKEESGRRYYGNVDINRLISAKKYRSMGVSLKAIASQFGKNGMTSDQVIARMREKKAEAERLSHEYAELAKDIERLIVLGKQGDGIKMAQAAGADVTGMGYTQLMPISWIDDGDLAFGSGAYCVYINPTTGKRFVNETSERDVLSLNEFRNGVEVNGVQGVFMEIANAEERVFPYAYLNADRSMQNHDVEWRQYVRTVDEFAELFAQLGFACDANTVIETIKAYDYAYMTDSEYPDVEKTGASRLIGTADMVDGKYDVESYKLDGVELRIRIMAPSTHHTMGGIKVDIDRHVLATDGSIIPGLYAAGEVTGGIHGGNRLGGNALVEIFVSGRTAAQAANADAQ